MDTTDSKHQQQDILSTTDGETAFFRSVIRYRPRGYNRHFSMLGICKDLEKELQVVIPSHQIWNTLRSCYNLDLLAEMEPDDPEEIDRSKSTIELLNLKQTFFQEFQLPIHVNTPREISFLELVNERRLDTSSTPSSPDQANLQTIHSPRSKRTTANSSSKLHHQDQRNISSTNKHQNKQHPIETSNTKSTAEHRFSEEGIESDLTEQEDYDDDDEDDEDNIDENEQDESTPERKVKKLKTTKQQTESNTTNTASHSNRSRHNTNNNNSSSSTKQMNSSLARSNRSRNRTRWKK